VGAVLLQDGQPLAFLSRALGPKNKGLSAYEKEYMAILIAVDHWRSYLQLGEFTIYTDQKSLVHLSDQRLHTAWQQKVFTKLLGLQYRIVYKPGIDNRVADALSRRGQEAELMAISVPLPVWFEDIKASYSDDAKCKTLLAKLALSPDAEPPFQLHQGLLRYKDRIWVGNDGALQHKIIDAFHSSPIGGHSGVPASYQRLKRLFAWSGLKSAVQLFVQSCPTCQQAKPDRAKYPGLLQPLPVPSMAWQSISMDFIDGLPLSKGKNCILVIVDRFSKYSHFVPLAHPFTAQSVAKLFLHNIYRLHGLPASIISDRDKVFTSRFWRELFRLAGVSLKMSSAYHPQTDGQTERVNQCLETFLRCFISASPTKWTDWICLAEFWYNTSWHSSLGHSPFFVLYGHHPKHFGVTAADATQPASLDDWLQERSLIQSVIQQHLARAQKRMKTQADKGRSDRQFAEGDWVYLKLQPYVQTSVAPRANQKLAFKFFGPFQVASRIGTVAYKLHLPATSAIHPVFHVSQLKTAVPADSKVSMLPQALEGLQIPVKVLQRRVRTSDNSVVPQVLIQWSSLPRSLATWEDLESIKQRFPRAPAWGQAASLREGDVISATEEDAVTSELDVPEAEHDAGTSKDASRSRRSQRTRRASVLISGPEWA
jgi:transposase InsO family protein